MSNLQGQTRILAIIGDPIAQVRSPEIYNPRLAKAGLDAILIPLQVPAASFDAAIGGLMAVGNIDGMIVTYPFKERILPYLAGIGPIGGQVGAVNAIRRQHDGGWFGDMFDGAGLIGALSGVAQSARERQVLLLGAGGAGSAIAVALAADGANRIGVFDRTRGRAQTLAAKVNRFYPDCAASVVNPDIGGFDLLVNATPAGMAPDFALPLFTGDLHPGLTVIDIVPKPAETALLALAKAAGCPHANGGAMISGQADAVIAFFFKGART
jgi:shikimate dehydrogenase